MASFSNETFVNLHVDKDKQGALADRFKVGGIPDTLFVTADGKVVTRIVGFLPADGFLKKLQAVPALHKKRTEADAAISKDANDPAAHLALGQCLASSGAYAEAETHFQAVIDTDKDNAKGLAVQAWFGMGGARMDDEENQDLTGAKEAFGKVVELDAKNEKGNTDNAAVLLARIKVDADPKAARADYEKALADFPKTDGAAEAMFMIGALMAEQDEDYDGAEKQMKKLIEEMPESEWAAQAKNVLPIIDKMRNASKEKKE